MADKPITCESCKFCLLIDNGYSNYTVEGTDFVCAKKLHPEAPFDRFYGEDKRLEFASQCTGFIDGSPIIMDVEQENLAELTPDERAIWDAA